MSVLNDLLPPGAVNLHGEAYDWRAALNLAGGLLEEAGKITPGYTAAMVQSVEDHGPYIVVAPGFALAHARPGGGQANSDLLGAPEQPGAVWQ